MLLLLVLLHSWAVHHFHCLHIPIVTVQLDISMKFCETVEYKFICVLSLGKFISLVLGLLIQMFDPFYFSLLLKKAPYFISIHYE